MIPFEGFDGQINLRQFRVVLCEISTVCFFDVFFPTAEPGQFEIFSFSTYRILNDLK